MQIGALSKPVVKPGAKVPRQPRSLTWRNPALVLAEAAPAASAPAPAPARQTVAATAATAALSQTSAVGSLGSAAPRVSGKTLAWALKSAAGARASALGRAHGGVAKPRSNKLQRIGEHLYRAQTGTGGRTLQRQGATPTYSARPAKWVRHSFTLLPVSPPRCIQSIFFPLCSLQRFLWSIDTR